MSSLRAIQLTKRFPGVVALNNVSLEVRRGSIHALVGANGAGKSTLIKILTGYYETYEGSMEIDSKPVSIRQPADALSQGIEVVHQEVDVALIPYLSATENLFIEQLAEGRQGTFLRWAELHTRARDVLAQIGLQIDPRRSIETLSLHEKQLLLIARALFRRVRYLILDEPTASLSAREVERLFEVLRALRSEGVGIIYISHRLAEIAELADEISVLRNGQLVAHFERGVSLSAVVEAMLGDQLSDAFPPRRKRQLGEVILEARDLARLPSVRGVSFHARRGEVLGIAGLVGAGKTELLRLLFGADQPASGTVLLRGTPLRLRHPSDAVRHGIYLVPEERRKQGLLVENSLRENVSLPFLQAFSVFGWVLRSRERARALDVIQRLRVVTPGVEALVKNLSGGNQQKVVVGRWLTQKPSVMLFDEATQGIDIKAKREIYDLAQQLSEDAAVIYASSDIDEVMAISDRVLVMRDGRVVAEVDPANTDRRLVLEYATGASTQL